MKSSSRLNLAVVCALTLVWPVTGCTSHEDDSTGRNASSVGAAADTITPVAGVRGDTVIIHMMQFSPEVIRVNKGDTVVWINKDIVAHNVTQYPDTAWTSDTIPTGAIWKRKIDAQFDYFCSIHPTMKGQVIIDP